MRNEMKCELINFIKIAEENISQFKFHIIAKFTNHISWTLYSDATHWKHYCLLSIRFTSWIYSIHREKSVLITNCIQKRYHTKTVVKNLIFVLWKSTFIGYVYKITQYLYLHYNIYLISNKFKVLSTYKNIIIISCFSLSYYSV